MADDSRLNDLKLRWEQDPGSRLYLQLADEYRKLERYPEAIEVLTKGLEKRPNDLSGLVALGRCQLEAADFSAAAETLESVVGRDPAHMVANKLLLETYLGLGDAARAGERLELYRVLNDRDPEIEHYEYRLRGLRSAIPPPAAAPADPEPALPEAAPELPPVDEPAFELAAADDPAFELAPVPEPAVEVAGEPTFALADEPVYELAEEPTYELADEEAPLPPPIEEESPVDLEEVPSFELAEETPPIEPAAGPGFELADEPTFELTDEPTYELVEDEPPLELADDEPPLELVEDEPPLELAEDEPPYELAEDEPVEETPEEELTAASGEPAPPPTAAPPPRREPRPGELFDLGDADFEATPSLASLWGLEMPAPSPAPALAAEPELLSSIEEPEPEDALETAEPAFAAATRELPAAEPEIFDAEPVVEEASEDELVAEDAPAEMLTFEEEPVEELAAEEPVLDEEELVLDEEPAVSAEPAEVSSFEEEPVAEETGIEEAALEEGVREEPAAAALPDVPETEEPTAEELPSETTATLGELYLAQGHHREAERIFREVLRRDPDNAAAKAGLQRIPVPAPAAAGGVTAPQLLARYAHDRVIPEGLTAKKVLVLESYRKHLRSSGQDHVH